MMINKFKSVLDYFKKAFTFFDNSKIDSYQVEHTLDAVHGIKKDETPEVEAEKTLIEAKSKLREKRKAPKKIKVPKDIV